MGKTVAFTGGSREYKKTKYDAARDAYVISMVSSLRHAGNSYLLGQAVNNPLLNKRLQAHNKKGLVVDLSPHKEYNSYHLIQTTERKRIFHAESGLFYISHFPSFFDPYKEFLRRKDDLVLTSGNLDLVTLTSVIGKEELVDIGVQNVPIFIDFIRPYYDFILIDFPPVSTYYPYFQVLLKRTNFLVLPYPLSNPSAMDSLFAANSWYCDSKKEGVPIQLGRIIPVGTGIDLNSYADQIARLTEIFPRKKIGPVIPDPQQDPSRIRKDIREIVDVGPDPLVEMLISLICGPRPHGLNSNSRKFVPHLLEIWEPLKGTNWNNFKVLPVYLRGQPEATLAQIAFELSGSYDQRFADYLINEMYFAGFQRLEFCKAKVKAPIGQDVIFEPTLHYPPPQADENDDEAGIFNDPAALFRLIEKNDGTKSL